MCARELTSWNPAAPADLVGCSPTSLRPAPAHTTSLHLLPCASSTGSSCERHLAPLQLTLPTGVLADLPFVESANVALVWLGAAWLASVA